jgi:hypothetical protein
MSHSLARGFVNANLLTLRGIEPRFLGNTPRNLLTILTELTRLRPFQTKHTFLFSTLFAATLEFTPTVQGVKRPERHANHSPESSA